MPPSFSTSAAAFALAFALTSPSTVAVMPRAAIAQSADASNKFTLPESVSSGTVIRIDGSDSMRRINQVLQQGFEETYSGTDVQTEYSGTAAALDALGSGDIDLAAIGRPLTDAEKAQGLVEIPIERHKIALIVSPSSTFDGSLTTEQFGQIFRGEITDWSAVGGAPGTIRLIDRPETSDTRQAFLGYPVFQQAPFETGETAVTLTDDSTNDVISELGDDGLGYAIADQVFDDPNVRIVPMHNTRPDDARYPFSQPLAYVYQGDTPSPAAQAFLGYAVAPKNTAPLETARVEGALSAVDGSTADDTAAGAVSGDAGDASSPDGVTAADGTASGDAPDGAIAAGATGATGAAAVTAAGATDSEEVTASGAGAAGVDDADGAWPWWWLLLLVGLPLLLLLLLRRRQGDAPPTASPVAGEPDLAAAPVGGPVLEPAVDPVVGMAPGAAAVPPVAAASGLGAAGLPRGEVIPPIVPLAPMISSDGSRVAVTAKSPQTLHANWTIADQDRDRLHGEGAEHMALRLHDITGLASDAAPHRTWQFPCPETDAAMDVDSPDLNATYTGEIGYVTADNRWLGLARSQPVKPSGLRDLPVLGLAGGLAAGAAAGVMASRSGNAAAALEDGAGTQLALSPQLSNTLQADWTLSPQDAAAVAAQPGPLLLRLYDATGLDLAGDTGPLIGQYHCDKSSRNLQIPVAQGDRDYIGELGYLSAEAQWIPLVRSEKVRLTSPTTDSVAGTVTGAVPDGAIAPETGLDNGLSLSVAAAAAAAAAATSSGSGASSPDPLPTDAELTGTASPGADPGDTPPSYAATSEPEASTSAVFSQPTASQIALHLPDGEAALAHWTLSEDDRQRLLTSSDPQLELRVHDVTEIDIDQQAPFGTQTYVLSPGQDKQPVTVPVGDRDYLAELGYLDEQQGWTALSRSAHVYIPSGSPAVTPIGQLEPGTSTGSAGLPPSDGLAGRAAVAVGLGAVAPTTTPRAAAKPQISQIILVASSPQQAYVYWEISEVQRALLKEQGGRHMKLRVHDATGLDIDYQPPHSTMEFDCHESDRDCHVTIPARDRDYIAEVGYTTDAGDWLRIIRSFHTWIPS